MRVIIIGGIALFYTFLLYKSSCDFNVLHRTFQSPVTRFQKDSQTKSVVRKKISHPANRFFSSSLFTPNHIPNSIAGTVNPKYQLTNLIHQLQIPGSAIFIKCTTPEKKGGCDVFDRTSRNRFFFWLGGPCTWLTSYQPLSFIIRTKKTPL